MTGKTGKTGKTGAKGAGAVLGAVAIAAVLMASHARLLGQARAKLPDAAQVQLARGIHYGEYLDMKRLYGLDSAAFAEIDGTAGVAGGAGSAGTTGITGITGGTRIKLVFAEEGFARITGLPIARGAFFLNAENNVAVISDELARSLFMSMDIIGANISINGLEYAVCGVYESGGGLAETLSADSFSRVYAPLASEAGRAQPVRDFFLAASEGAGAGQSILSRLAPTVKSHSDTLALIAQNGRLQWFFLTISAAALMFALGMREAGGLFGHSAGRREMAACAGLFAASAVVVWLSMFQPFFPQSLLNPSGRIDFAHLFGLFLADAKAANTAGADFWARFGHRALLWSCALCAGTLAAAGIALAGAYKAIAGKAGNFAAGG
jgi:hypothetical protein